MSAQSISKKGMRILPCIGELYHRFKQNVLESESRQFDRLRLRLRLLARCHDSGRLQLRLRLRLRTPAGHYDGTVAPYITYITTNGTDKGDYV